MPRTKTKPKSQQPPKPVKYGQYDISVKIPLYSKVKDDRYVETLQRLGMIEKALSIVGAEYEIAPYSTNEEY